MAGQWKSILGGAAVAALLIIPASAGNTGGNGDWTSLPWRSYEVHTVKVDSLVGHLRVEVKPQAQVSVQISGRKPRLDRVSVHASGDTLVVASENDNEVWDWKSWFDFSAHDSSERDVDVHVVVPKGTAIRVDDMVGDAQIGDTEGDMRFEAVASTTTIGKVKDARISMMGSGRIQMSEVMGTLKLDIAGSGKIKAASTKSVDADIAGSGSAELGAIDGGLSLDIAGSGNFNAARVNGPVKVGIMGAGSVNIPQGTANPLHVDIMGAGNFVFGGEAIDPHVSALGSGRVKLRSYKGRMDSDGMVDVQVGPEGFPVPPAPPAPPAMKAPSAPPAPPAPPKGRDD
jgi:hypothetical protein